MLCFFWSAAVCSFEKQTSVLRVCDGCFDYHFPPSRLPTVSIPTAVPVGEGRNTVFHYVLKISADAASAGGGQWGVVRRYSQFEALRTRILAVSADEHGVPPALAALEFPPKTSWFSSAEEVVAERRVGLDQWLGAVRRILMEARTEEKGMVSAIREVRQFLAADESVQELGAGPAAQVSAALGVLRAGNGGRGGPAALGAPTGGGGGGGGGGGQLLDQLGDMVSGNLSAVKAMNKEGNRQNKLLDRATEATDRGRDGVGGMLDTYAAKSLSRTFLVQALRRLSPFLSRSACCLSARVVVVFCRMHAQGYSEASAKEVRLHTATRGGGGGGGH